MIKRIPQKALAKIEAKAQFFQGKGWGAASTNFEVAAIGILLKQESDLKILAFDVGANVGNWSQAFIEFFPDGSVVAFEPGAEAFKVLQERFREKTKIKCVNLGLSDQNAKVTLYSDNQESALSSLNQRNLQHFNISLDKQEIVDVVRLDSWIDSQTESYHPTILKLDVEGHELSVLHGALETLRNIRVVQFEFGGGNIDSKTYFQDFWYFFTKRNFDLYRLTPLGPERIEQYSESLETFRPTNYFAVQK